MKQRFRKFSMMISVGVLLTVLALLLAYLLSYLQARAHRSPPLPILSNLSDFNLTNQSGQATTLANLRDRVWVADIIFTRCPGPCLKMTRQMKELQDALPADSKTRLVTLTTDPDYDTPVILERFAARFNADTNRWTFLTGTKKELGALGGGGLKLTAVEVKPAERTSENDLFIHSTIFALVDRHGRLRAVFDTTGEGVEWPAEKEKILAAVRRLEHEP